MHDDLNPPILQDQKQDATVCDARRRAEEMVASGAPLREVLCHLVTVAEALSGHRTVVSILLLDENGRLHNGASPNLPVDYLMAIDRLKPNAVVGTCVAAAATGEIVITPDFSADSNWAGLRHLPQALGFLGAWSMPIKASNGRIVGTFGTYFREHRRPTSQEVHAVGILAAAAARAICASG
jgi:GAF domain-containing protein